MATGDTPFSLVYGTEAVIPIEVALPSARTEFVATETNDDHLRANLDLIEESRGDAEVRQAAYKAMTERLYNKRVNKVTLRPGDLVLRKNEASRQESTGKMGPNWEGPYRVTEAKENGSHLLETMQGKPLPRPWNIANLRKFHF